jgi:NAD(P)H-dependent FMN reductase
MRQRIVFIIGSLRKNSFNKRLAQKAEELIGDRAEVEWLEYSRIPYFCQDIEFPAPKDIERIRNRILKADGVWIFTAEYNYQIPGGLKNLLDWLSRPVRCDNVQKISAVEGKCFTVSGVSGKSAASGARQKLCDLLKFMHTNLMEEPQTGVALPMESFVHDDMELSEQDINNLTAQANAFINFVKPCVKEFALTK